MGHWGHIVIFCMICFGVYFLSLPVFALPSIQANPTNVPSAYIVGYVLDEDGKPVPMATVSLWQDGQLWRAKLLYVPGDNPQTSRVAYTNETGALGNIKEGGFLFGFTYPGDYTLTVEKDGYKTSPVKVHVGEETLSLNQLDADFHPITVNITLNGYHTPTLTPGQRANTGAIIGSITSQYGQTGGNVSLWQGRQLVALADNPQMAFSRDYSGKEVDYVFEHLSVGHYTVKVIYRAGPVDEEETFPVDVGTDTVIADIVLTKMPPMHISTYVPDPSQPTTSEPSSPRPTPAQSGLAALLVLGFVTYYLANKK